MMMMKMIMLLLVSTLALLVNSASARPQLSGHHHDTNISGMNMRRIFNLVKNHTQSLSKDVLESYVENISNLTKHPNKCQTKFFCKVEKILAQHKNFGSEDEIVQTLAVHNQASCDTVKVNKPGTGHEIQLKAFLKDLLQCIRHWHVRGAGIATS